MGLDMFLNAKRHFYGSDSETEKRIMELLFPESKDIRLSSVSVELMYWRKANAIHRWFVENCQSGEDNCQETWVPRKDLEKLLRDIDAALDNPESASKVFPTQGGFFFGSTDIDEYYWHIMRETRERVSAILDDPQFEGCDFYYRSSW